MDGVSVRGAPVSGLSHAEAEARLKQFGPNELPEPPLPGPLTLFARQFLSPFIYILLIAAVVSAALQQWPSAIFIMAVLLLNAVIGTIQEVSATRAAAALRKMVRGHATVIREGQRLAIAIEDVVPDDIVLLESGDKIPADILLSQSRNLSVDESMLTGESLAVIKNADATVDADAGLADQVNRLFAGTIITRGRAQGRVTATGLATEIGKISKRITAKRVSEPPLMIRIRRFTYKVAAGIVIAIALLAGLMLIKGGYDAEGMVLMAIGLAVSTIPEGLPAALTVPHADCKRHR